ncbi:MAG: hypothetical protein IH631_03315 [Candidatus Thorarchaeota archaeon]|jgi:hypothetical protein|nr:hypothetical protein [Candidatus Thorarchaeota archaeon]
MTDVIDAEDFMKESMDVMEITGRYVFIRINSGMRGPNWEKAMYALNTMESQGWKFVQWISYGAFGGYLLERA